MTGTDPLRVSLIATLLNEEEIIGDLLDSIASQTRRPDEIILVDGGSTDCTVEIIERYRARLPIQVVVARGFNISEGRNLALSRATGDVVAITDAGVRLEPNWLFELTLPFTRASSEQPDVVSGFFIADPRSQFETALAVTTLPDQDDIDPAAFLPSSRSVAVRRSLVEAGLSYPEWLDYCEDLVFDLRLRRAGARFTFQPSARVWFRPRRTLREFWRQYYRYARGDGKAGLFPRRHVVRYVTYLVFLPALVARPAPMWTALGIVGGLIYMRRPWQRLWKRRHGLSILSLMSAAVLAPVLRLTGDAAKMAGYPAGLWWRFRNYGLRKDWRTIPERGLVVDAQPVDERVAEKLGRP